MYTGSVNGVTNLVYFISDSVVQYIRLTGATAVWRFDTDTGEFVAVDVTGVRWVSTFIDDAGLNATGSSNALRLSSITRDMVTHRAVPL